MFFGLDCIVFSVVGVDEMIIVWIDVLKFFVWMFE